MMQDNSENMHQGEQIKANIKPLVNLETDFTEWTRAEKVAHVISVPL